MSCRTVTSSISASTSSAHRRPLGPRHAFWRDTVVLALVLAGFFDALSGRPIHGLFLIAVGVTLLWDSRRPTSPGRATDHHRETTAAVESQTRTDGERWVRIV